MAKKKAKVTKARPQAQKATPAKSTSKYPRHSLDQVLRIPKAILDQNAGKDCSDEESANFLNLKYNRGPYATELSSAIKFGLLERPSERRIAVTALAKQILRPQDEHADIKGLREAVLKAPVVADVYLHYRGEYLPDDQFLDNALVDKFGIPREKLAEFRSVFFDSLKRAKLLEEHDGRTKVLDVTGENGIVLSAPHSLNRVDTTASVKAGDSCFVMMPFGSPLGTYYDKIYKPAIEKTGLTPVRADSEIFGTGKIMDQIVVGIQAARVLVAELTSRNPNVFYELGLAHALQKPVVLVSSNEEDVPFDLKHIRVIIYDTADPFWGTKLLEKVAENIVSALNTPEEAVFRVADRS